MTLFRHNKTKRLYCLYKVSPRAVTGSWLESEDVLTKETRKLNVSSWKRDDFVAVAHR